MADMTAARVGRPRASSRAMLAEAAAELFLEQTYAGTTIGQIARRAGVSRNTFFTYCSAKSDLLWVEVDAGLAGLPLALAECDPVLPATDAVRQALLRIAAGFGPGQVPWALTQHDLMGTGQELAASALSRLLAQADLLSRFAGERSGRAADALPCRSFALAVLAAAAAGAGVWAGSGVARGSLAPYLDAAVSPVCAGFRGALAAG